MSDTRRNVIGLAGSVVCVVAHGDCGGARPPLENRSPMSPGRRSGLRHGLQIWALSQESSVRVPLAQGRERFPAWRRSWPFVD
jgi:hypothetical protein